MTDRLPLNLPTDPPPLDNIQLEPRCPTCLIPLKAIPRSRVPCWKCGVVLYPRTLDGERVLANDAGLEELRAYARHKRDSAVGPCPWCWCTIPDAWRFCPYCETDRTRSDPCLSRELTPKQLDKVLERQLVEAMPELHTEAWQRMTPWERLSWLRRWQPKPEVSMYVAFRCKRCGAVLRTGACGECRSSAGKQ